MVLAMSSFIKNKSKMNLFIDKNMLFTYSVEPGKTLLDHKNKIIFHSTPGNFYLNNIYYNKNSLKEKKGHK